MNTQTLGSTKIEVRHTVRVKTAAFVNAGGTIRVLRERASCGMSVDDWKRAVRAERFVSPADVAELRTAELKLAIANKDTDRCAALISGKLDRKLKERLLGE